MTGNIIISPITQDGNIPIQSRGFLYSHENTLTTNRTLTANRNHYVDSAMIINDLVTLTIPNNTILIIE